jgi:hypothetical protein
VWRWSRGSARSFHALNLAMHAANSALVFLFLDGLKKKKKEKKSIFFPLTAALIFAVHPVHCESVCGIVGLAGMGFTNFLELFLTRILNAILNRLRIDS